MTEIELLFKGLPLIGQPIELVFGEDDEAPIVDSTVSIRGRMPALRGRVPLALGIGVTMRGTMPKLRGRVTVRYATDTSRPTVGAVTAQWQAAAGVQAGQVHTWQNAQALAAPTRQRWRNAEPASTTVTTTWSDADRGRRASITTRWQDAASLHQAVNALYQDTLRTARSSVAARWQDAVKKRHSTLVRFQEALRDRRTSITTRWQDAGRVENGIKDSAQPAVAVYSQWSARWQNAIRPPAGTSKAGGSQPTEPCYLPPHGLQVELLFSDAWTASTALLFVCERHTPPLPGTTITIPILRYYVTINSIEVRRVDGDIDLQTYGFSMSLDYESWTWSWNAAMRKDALVSLQPGLDGDPIELEAKINGVPYRLQVEKIGRDTQFESSRIRVSGRGKAALLSAPHAPVMNFGNLVGRTAQQLMADVLTVNGVGIGWGLDFGLTDWVVPAGAWTFQGTYMDAINDIASAVGAYIQPHATESILRVLPRYPAVPWAWAGITPDYELPAAAVSLENTEWIDRPTYNAVYVGGISSGVFGPFKRAGTDGSRLAPQVNHALITHADAHRQRGMAVLSDTGRQAHLELKMQVRPETGLILPGKFVRYVGDTTRIGIVRRTSLDWSTPVMRQTLGVETHVA